MAYDYTEEELEYLEKLRETSPESTVSAIGEYSAFGKEEASPFRQLQYGFDKSTWLGGNVYRYLAAGGDEALLREREKKRLRELDREYSDLTSKEKASGWSIAGDIGGTLLDPTVIPLSVGASAVFASKAAQLGRSTQKLLNATTQGSVGAGDYAIHEISKGNEIDPSALVASATVGGLLGSLFLPKGLKLTPAEKVERTVETVDGTALTSNVQTSNVLPELSVKDQKIVNDILYDFYKKEPDSIGKIVGNANNGYKFEAADKIINLFQVQKNLRAGGFKDREITEMERAGTILSDRGFEELKKANKMARSFKRNFYKKELVEQSEEISDDIMNHAGQLQIKGNLNANTMAHIVYRPLVGAIAGFGVSTTTSLYSGEEFNPIPWMIAGAAGGAFSKKINNSQYVSEVKEAGDKAVKTVISNSMWEVLNVFFSGGVAAKAQAFGGRVHAVSYTHLTLPTKA